MGPTFYQNETISILTPLIGSKSPKLGVKRITVVDGGASSSTEADVVLSQPIPHHQRGEGTITSVFLSGQLNGCFEVLEVDECWTTLRIELEGCVELQEVNGRFVSTCCGGSVFIKGVESFAQLPLQSCFCGAANNFDIGLDVRIHVVDKDTRARTFFVTVGGTKTLMTSWENRSNLPTGVKLSIPGLELAEVGVVAQKKIQNKFLGLELDTPIIVDPNHGLVEARICPTVDIGVGYQIEKDCPIARTTFSTESAAAGTYHWDIFADHSGGKTHIDRGSFTLISGY